MRARSCVLTGVLALLLSGLPAAGASADPVLFPDPVLRGCVAKELGVKSDHDFTTAELGSVKRLSCSPKEKPLLHDLTGIARLSGLEWAAFEGQQLHDLAPLDGLESLRYLLLTRSTVTRVPEVLELPALEHLSLERSTVADLGFLESLPALKVLNLRGFVGDLSPLTEVPALTTLLIGQNRESDLAVLPSLKVTGLDISEPEARALPSIPRPPAVSKLSINGPRLEDLSAITEWGTVTDLTLSTPVITDISPIAGLDRLARLAINAGVLSDLAPVRRAVHLETLIVGRNRVVDLSPLAGLARLKKVTLPGNQVTSLAGVTSLTTLTELDLSGNKVVELSDLQGLGNLKVLNLDANSISDLRPLAGAVGLTSLDLGNNTITDIAALGGLAGVTSLDLSNNRITDVAALGGLGGLTSLNLNNNRITDVTGLGRLSGLTSLSLNSNRIADVSGLAGLSGLTTLDLSFNKIIDVSALAGLSRLTRLHLNDSGIIDVAALGGMVRLTHLGLQRNSIVDVAPLSGLDALESLWLTDNLIEDAAPLAHLPGTLPLDLSGNALLDLRPLAGRQGAVRALGQRRTLPPGKYGTPYPVQIAGLDGSAPNLNYLSDGTSYRGGKLIHTYAGENSLFFIFSSERGGDFSGEISQRIGPDQPFVLRPHTQDFGSPSVGLDLEAYVGRWSPTPTQPQFQWYRDKTPIKGATQSYYRATGKDLGHRLRARVTAVRDGYISQSRYTPYSRKVGRGTFYDSARPRISGSLKTGKSLTAQVGYWSPTPTKFSYQWYRGSKKIAGATKKSYTLTAADLGKRIKVRLTGRASGVDTRYEFSKATAKVQRGEVRSAAPGIRGATAQGGLLKVVATGWGPSKVTFTFQWRRDGKSIKGASGRTYRVTGADAGHKVTVSVRGSRKGYRSVTRTSAPVSVPAVLPK